MLLWAFWEIRLGLRERDLREQLSRDQLNNSLKMLVNCQGVKWEKESEREEGERGICERETRGFCLCSGSRSEILTSLTRTTRVSHDEARSFPSAE